MGALGLFAVAAGIMLLRAAVTATSPLDVAGDVLGRAGYPWITPRNRRPDVDDDRPEVARWRSLVSAHFPPGKIDEALRVMYCESRGNPQAVNRVSGASGLFQHLPKYWQQRSAAAGYSGANIMDPTANVAVAAWLYKQSMDWRHWTCKP